MDAENVVAPTYEGTLTVVGLAAATFQTAGLNGGRYHNIAELDSSQQDKVIACSVPLVSAQNAHLALERSFEAAKKETERFHESGSTVSVAIITPDGFLTVAQMGDSPIFAFVMHHGSGTVDAVDLTTNQDPESATERARIESEGFVVENNRIYRETIGGRHGGLAVSRAFGDRQYGGAVSQVPIFSVINISDLIIDPGVRLILAVGSDGLTEFADPRHVFDQLSSREAVAIIATRLVDHAVVETSKLRAASDNISVSVAQITSEAPSIAIGVMDGHGVQGETVAIAVREAIISNLCQLHPAPSQAINVENTSIRLSDLIPRTGCADVASVPMIS